MKKLNYRNFVLVFLLLFLLEPYKALTHQQLVNQNIETITILAQANFNSARWVNLRADDGTWSVDFPGQPSDISQSGILIYGVTDINNITILISIFPNDKTFSYLIELITIGNKHQGFLPIKSKSIVLGKRKGIETVYINKKEQKLRIGRIYDMNNYYFAQSIGVNQSMIDLFQPIINRHFSSLRLK